MKTENRIEAGNRLLRRISLYDVVGEIATEDQADGLYYVMNTELDEREKKAIIWCYYRRRTLTEWAGRQGITKARASQIFCRGLEKLKSSKRLGYIKFGVVGYGEAKRKAKAEVEKTLEEMQRKITRLYGVRIESLDIGVRSLKALRDKGLWSVGDTADFIEQEGSEWYKTVKGLGEKGAFEVEERIHEETEKWTEREAAKYTEKE